MTITLPGVGMAQVNIEALRRESIRPGLSGALGADFAVRTGNVRLVQVGLSTRADRARGRSHTFLVGAGDVGFQGGVRFSNAGLLHLRSSYAVQPRLLPEAYAQANYDRARKLLFRAVAGAGLRVRVLERGAARLWLGSGYMFEHERLDLAPTARHPARTSLHRWSSYASARVAGRTGWVLVATTYVQPRLDAAHDLRILGEATLAAPVTEHTSLALSLNARYDSRPPDGIRSLDTELRSGVRLAF